VESDLTFLHCRHTPRCDAVVDKYFEGYYTLQFMSQGAIALSYEQSEYSLAGAWFWPAFPGPLIRFRAAPGRKLWNHRYVAFRGPLANRWLAEGLMPREPQKSLNATRHARLFDELLGFAQRADGWGTRRAINALENILLELAEERAATARHESWLDDVLRDLENETQFMPDYALLARRHGMALSTLRRRFREATGIPIHEYSLQRRIARARELLGETELPLKTVAAKLGYGDVYFFRAPV
jgi:AraC-like DNA-binding protein